MGPSPTHPGPARLFLQARYHSSKSSHLPRVCPLPTKAGPQAKLAKRPDQRTVASSWPRNSPRQTSPWTQFPDLGLQPCWTALAPAPSAYAPPPSSLTGHPSPPVGTCEAWSYFRSLAAVEPLPPVLPHHDITWLACLLAFFRSFFLSFFFCFLGSKLQHMGVLKLEVELELQPPAYTIATATPDLSHFCDPHHSS